MAGKREQHDKIAAASDNQEPPQPQDGAQQGEESNQVTRGQEQQQQQQQPPLKRLGLIRRQLFCGFMSPSLSIEKQVVSLHDQNSSKCSPSSSKSQTSSASAYHSQPTDKKTRGQVEKQIQQQIAKKNKNTDSGSINRSCTFEKPATAQKTTTNSTTSSLLTYFNRQSARRRYQLGQQSSEDRSGAECCISLSGFQRANNGSNNSSSSSTTTNSINVGSRNRPRHQSRRNSSDQQSIGESRTRINHQLVKMAGISPGDASIKREQLQQLEQRNNHLKSSNSLKLTNQRKVLELIGASPNQRATIMRAHRQMVEPNESEHLMLTSQQQNKQPVSCSGVIGETTTCSQSISAEKSSTITTTTTTSATTSTSTTTTTRSSTKASSSQAAHSLRQHDSKPQEQDQMNLLISLLNQFARQQEQYESQLPGIGKDGSSIENTQLDPYYLEENWTSFVQISSSQTSPSTVTTATNCAQRQHPDRLANSSSISVAEDRNQLANLRIQQDAIWELLTTEVFYIKRLKVIIDIFLKTLLSLQRASLLLEIDAQQITSNICEVYEANSLLWVAYLQPMLSKSRTSHCPLDPTLMRDAFVQIRNIFNPYYRYCLEHTNCLKYVKEQNRINEYFKVYLAWCESQRDCERLKLTDLLAKPMQRLTRYVLLLKAIIKKTDNEEQFVALEQMISQTNKFVLTVDLELRRKDDVERLLSVANRVDSYDFGSDTYNDEIEKLIKTHYLQFDLLKPLFNCPFSCQRQLLFDSQAHTQNIQLGQLKFKDAQINSKIEVVLLIFTDNLFICKQINYGSRWHYKDKDYHQISAHQSTTSSHHSPTRQASSSTVISSINCNISQPNKHLNPTYPQQQHHLLHLRQRTNSEIQQRRLNPSPNSNGGLSQGLQSVGGMLSPRAFSLIFTHGESNHVSGENEFSLFDQDTSAYQLETARQRHSGSNSHLLASAANLKPATTSVATASNQSNRSPSHHSSTSSLMGHAAREFFLRNGANSRSGDNLDQHQHQHQQQQQQQQQQRQQKQLGSYHNNLLNISSNSIVNLTNHCQTNTGASNQQQAAANEAHLRVIRAPYPIERLVMHELKDGQSVFCCQMNDSRTIANSFVLYSSVAPPPLSEASSKVSDQWSTNRAPTSNTSNGAHTNSHSKTYLGASSESFNGHTSNPTFPRRSSSDAKWLRTNQASLSPARQLINLIKQAQIRYQLAANFHSVNLHTFESPEREEGEEELHLQQNKPLGQKSTNNKQQQQQQQHRSRLSTWSSFRHSSRIPSDCAASSSSKQAKTKGLNSQGSLKQDSLEIAKLSARNVNNQRQTWLLDRRSASSENQVVTFETSQFEAGRRASSSGLTDQKGGPKRNNPFIKAIIEQHQSMLLNHARHEELATCDFRYPVVNSNYLNVVPIAVSLTSPSKFIGDQQQNPSHQLHDIDQEEALVDSRSEDKAQIGDKLRQQLMQCSQLGSQNSVFEESIHSSGGNTSQLADQQRNLPIDSARNNNNNNNYDQITCHSLNQNAGFSVSGDQAQLLSPNRYNLAHSRYKMIINRRRGTSSSIGSTNRNQLNTSPRLTIYNNENSFNNNLELSSDNEAVSEMIKPALSADNSMRSNTTSVNSSSTSSTRSSSPFTNPDNSTRKNTPQQCSREQQFRSRTVSQKSSETNPLRCTQTNRLQPVSISTSNINSSILSELSSELESEYSINTNGTNNNNSNNNNNNESNFYCCNQQVSAREAGGDPSETRRAPRRHLNSLRRQNVIQSVSSEQTQRELQQQREKEREGEEEGEGEREREHDSLKGNSNVKFRTKYLAKLSQRESSETTTSGPSASGCPTNPASNCKEYERTKQFQQVHNSSQATTMDQASVTFDESEDFLPGATPIVDFHGSETGNSSDIRATSFELGNLRNRPTLSSDGTTCREDVRSASIETSTTTASRSPVSVTLTVPHNGALQLNEALCDKYDHFDCRKCDKKINNQIAHCEPDASSPLYLKIPTKQRRTIGRFGGSELRSGDDTSWSNQSSRISASLVEASSCSNSTKEPHDYYNNNQSEAEECLADNHEYGIEGSSYNNTERAAYSSSPASARNSSSVLGKLRKMLNLNFENRAQTVIEPEDVDFESTALDQSGESPASIGNEGARLQELEGSSPGQVPVLNVTTASPQNLDQTSAMFPPNDSLENLSSTSLIEPVSHNSLSLAQKPMFATNRNHSFRSFDHSIKPTTFGSSSSCRSSPAEWQKSRNSMRRSSSSSDLKPNILINNNSIIDSNNSDISNEGNNHDDGNSKCFIKKCQTLFQFNKHRHNRHHLKTNFGKNKTRKVTGLDISKSQEYINEQNTSNKLGSLDERLLRPPEMMRRKYATNSDQYLGDTTVRYNSHERGTSIEHGSIGIPRLRPALSDVCAGDSFGEYDHGGTLIDMNCIGNLMMMRLNSENKIESSLDNTIFRDCDSSRNIAYLGFHEKLTLHNKQMKEEMALRERKKQHRQFSLTTTTAVEGDNQSQEKQLVVELLPRTEAMQKRASKLRAHFVTKSRQNHDSKTISNNSFGSSFGKTSRAFNLSRSMTGEIFDSFLKATSLRTVSGNNNSSS